MKRPAAPLFLLTAITTLAQGQARASLGVGVGTVRYPGGTSFSSASFSPGVQYASPTLAIDVSGSLASLPGGVWSSQGRGDVWVASSPLLDGWRIAAEAVAAGTSLPDGVWTAGAHGVAEVLWSQPRWGLGIGAGPSGGWVADSAPVAAFHSRARAWWRPGGEWRSDWQLTVEPTRLSRVWFTDATVAVTVERGAWIGSFWIATRLSRANASEGAGSAYLQFFASPRVALEIGGGGYLSDRYQDLPRARFVSFGVRLHGTPHLSVVKDSRTRWSPLIPEPRGDSLVVRFRFDSVKSVAIAGDWNEWRPIPLRPLGTNLWEGVLRLPRGLHHFNLLVDGDDWVVPNGVAAVSDGLGGIVGVLLVP